MYILRASWSRFGNNFFSIVSTNKVTPFSWYKAFSPRSFAVVKASSLRPSMILVTQDALSSGFVPFCKIETLNFQSSKEAASPKKN